MIENLIKFLFFFFFAGKNPIWRKNVFRARDKGKRIFLKNEREQNDLLTR